MASAAPTASKMTLTASAQSGAESCRWRAASRAISSVRVMAAFYAELLWARSRTPQTATPGADPERWPRDSICSICGRLVIGESLGKNRGGHADGRRRVGPTSEFPDVSGNSCQLLSVSMAASGRRPMSGLGRVRPHRRRRPTAPPRLLLSSNFELQTAATPRYWPLRSARCGALVGHKWTGFKQEVRCSDTHLDAGHHHCRRPHKRS
jgi:hypothetical protein